MVPADQPRGAASPARGSSGPAPGRTTAARRTCSGRTPRWTSTANSSGSTIRATRRSLLDCSRDLLARVPEHLIVTRADDLGWSDWGTPEAVERTFATLGVVPPWRVAQVATA